MIFNWLDMECDPVHPRFIHCDGLKLLLALPCMTSWQHMAYPSDPDICIEWRKAMQMSVALVPKIIQNPSGPVFRNYWITTYAQFNWKKRTQYHFAKFEEAISPWEPYRVRCVYLFKAPFRWGKFTAFHPDPINLYTRFRDFPLLSDGTPDIMWPKTWWAWTFPPDPMLYTDDEWRIITEWENIVFYYNHVYKRCIALYEFLNEPVTHTPSGRLGIVTKIMFPEREYEIWSPETEWAKRAVLQKLWMKTRPLRYRVTFPDKTYFDVARRYITRF